MKVCTNLKMSKELSRNNLHILHRPARTSHSPKASPYPGTAAFLTNGLHALVGTICTGYFVAVPKDFIAVTIKIKPGKEV